MASEMNIIMLNHMYVCTYSNQRGGSFGGGVAGSQSKTLFILDHNQPNIGLLPYTHFN